MFSFFLLILTHSVINAAEKKQSAHQWRGGVRCIEILPCIDITSEVSSETEYGEGRFFTTIEPRKFEQARSDSAERKSLTTETGLEQAIPTAEPQRASSGIPVSEQTSGKDLILSNLYDYYKNYLFDAGNSGGRNPLFVECEFFYPAPDSREKQISCGKVCMGLFVSGNQKFAIDSGTCKKIDEAKKTLESLRFLKDVKNELDKKTKSLTSQFKSLDGQILYYQLPAFSVQNESVPPISEGDINNSAKENSFNHQDRVVSRLANALLRKQGTLNKLFGHPSQDMDTIKGCFESNFDGCFTDSEQAWLDFLENPRPHHIFFSSNFDIQNAKTFSVTMFSYYDVCRYCRGTLSYLFGSKLLEDSFSDFFKKLPNLMQPHWDAHKIQKKAVSPSGPVNTGDTQGNSGKKQKQQKTESAAASTPETQEELKFPETKDMNFQLTKIYAYSLDQISDEPRGQLSIEEGGQ